MSIKRFAIVPAFVLLAAAPAQAVPFCTDSGYGEGFELEFGLEFGRTSTEQRNLFDLMELRRRGVDASRVERWNGCIRAYVRQPSGGEVMEFYDPNTYQQVF